MSVVQTNITLGTAGHIDHGKTVLIKCLTGCDTDRLKAEKERGMSIELGFAPCVISGLEVGIVDVPGHENFVKTMVAGASGIDGVIFVIAADDGVMPQTREHLDILTLLGVRHGIVALTKVDCIEPGRLEEVSSEIKEFLSGTFLEDAAILPVSGITGQGFEEFYETLKQLVSSIKPKETDGIFRMPVERAFSLKGYGAVITGIPVSGFVKKGDEVVLLPKGTKGRIKAIQVYKRESEIAKSGQCAAINIPHWDHKTIRRGDVVTLDKYFSAQQWYLCKVQILESSRGVFKNGTRIKFHTGTSEVVATMYLMEGNSITAGQGFFVQFKLSEPVVAGPCDRFILRTLSPTQTIGGGMIIEAVSKKIKRSRANILQDIQDLAKAVDNTKDFVEHCIKTVHNYAVGENTVSLRTKLLPGLLKEILTELISEGKVLALASKRYVHSETADYVQQQLLCIISQFHSKNPQSPGLSVDEFYKSSGLEKDVFEGLVKLLISQGKLIERKHHLALPDHRETFSESEQKLIEAVELLFKSRLFNPPKVEEIAEQVSAKLDVITKILTILVEQERLVKIDANLLFHSEAVDQARQRLVSYLEKENKLESVKFKYLLDTTRKFAIPLLDYFDTIGVTRRLGNTRYLKT